MITYFDKAVVEEEADGGGARRRALAVARGGDGRDDVLHVRARRAVEVRRERVADGRRSLPRRVAARRITNPNTRSNKRGWEEAEENDDDDDSDDGGGGRGGGERRHVQVREQASSHHKKETIDGRRNKH